MAKRSTKKLIFVSHAGKDKKLVDEFVNLLDTGMKVERDVIYQSSRRSLGTAAGKDFRETIGKPIRSSEIVVILLSSNYLNSQYCLGEMGAAWILGKRIFVFLIGNVSYSEIEGFLKTVDMGNIVETSRLSELYRAVRVALQVDDDNVNWENERDLFLAKITTIIPTLPLSETVPQEKFEHEVERRLDLQHKLQIAQEDLKAQKRLVEKILDDKVSAEQAQRIIRDEMPEVQQFVELCDQLEAALEGLDDVVLDAIRLYLAGEHLNYRPLDDDDDAAYNRRIDEAIDSGELSGRKGDYPHVQAKPNLDNMDTENAVNQASELDAWLGNRSTTVRNVLRRHYGFTPDLAKTEFWKAIKRSKHNTLDCSED